MRHTPCHPVEVACGCQSRTRSTAARQPTGTLYRHIHRTHRIALHSSAFRRQLFSCANGDTSGHKMDIRPRGRLYHPALPKLERLLFILNRWTRYEFGEGETKTVQNLLNSIGDDCIVQIRDKSVRFRGQPKWTPVWQERVDSDHRVPLEDGMVPEKGVTYYIPID